MDNFCVKVGSQVVFSNADKNLCDLVANRNVNDLLHRGCDVTNPEFQVKVIDQMPEVAVVGDE